MSEILETREAFLMAMMKEKLNGMTIKDRDNLTEELRNKGLAEYDCDALDEFCAELQEKEEAMKEKDEEMKDLAKNISILEAYLEEK
jgi:carbamoylphosphate synthase small subunit